MTWGGVGVIFVIRICKLSEKREIFRKFPHLRKTPIKFQEIIVLLNCLHAPMIIDI